jgi:TonB-linked SusC/RagA family outer membrane protein
MRKILLILCVLLIGLSAHAQNQITITGKISSAMDGLSVVANILVKGSNNGTSSASNGTYTLSNVPADAVLVISAVGYERQEIPVNNRKVINISLQSSDQSLDEVMVVAYGTAKKIPVTSFENALIGRVAGVQVTSASGQAGSTPSIRIRGIGSMSASNEPLYVIDGVPVVSGNAGQLNSGTYISNNIMSSLNPADIESITILKDAAASSLYGSRAANGVVLVTTKRGKTGAPLVNFKSSIGLTPKWATDNYEPAGIQEQINMLYQVFYDLNTSAKKTNEFANSNALSRLNTRFNKYGYGFSTDGTGLLDNVKITGLTDGIVNRDGTYFDWEKELFRTAVFQTNDLSVSGGDDKTNYYSSFSYTKDQSRVKVNNFDRLSGRINLTQKVGRFVEFTTNANIGRSKQSGYNDTRNTGTNYFFQSRNLLWPLYWPTDYKTGAPMIARYGSLAYNANYYDNEWDNSSINLRVSASETLNIKILPELNLKSIFSYDNARVKDHLYYSAQHFNGVLTNGSVSEINTNINKIVSSTTLNYNKQFGQHGLALLAGFEIEKNRVDYERVTGTDLPSSTLYTVSTAGKRDGDAYNWGYNMMSVLSRAEYNYNQKYFASASYRRDGSSKLGPDTRWGNFWSVAGSWKISGEDFMKPLEYISSLRLRGSYGTNGTTPIENYSWRTLTDYKWKYMEQPGGIIGSIGNEFLTWENSQSTNVALEFGLFNNRITGTIEYFNRDAKRLLQDKRISMVTGFSSITENVGEINNRGLELEIGGDIIRKVGLRWSASINASFIKSKVTKLYRGNDIIWYDPTGGDKAGEDRRAQFIYREGQSMLSFYGYEWAGVNPENGKNVWYVNNPNDPMAGETIYNNRGATYDYTKANYKVLGSAMPDVYGGFNTDVEYKGLSLALNFNYKIGGKLYDGASKDVADDGYYWERIRSKYYDEHRWTPQRTDGSLPKLDGNDLTDAIQYSSRQMYDASFFRLKNVTLAYNLPKDMIKKVGLANTRVYFNGSNLLTFSKYKIADPEVNQFGTRGWETPFGKTYTFGVEFSF